MRSEALVVAPSVAHATDGADLRVARQVAIIAAAAAGLAHAVSTPDHWRWWRASGVLFALLTVVQCGLAYALWRRWKPSLVLAAGVVTNAAVVLLYVFSRTVGVPGAPPIYAHGGHGGAGRPIVPGAVESIGPFDLYTLAAELVLLGALLALMTARSRRAWGNAIGLTGAALWALLATGSLW